MRWFQLLALVVGLSMFGLVHVAAFLVICWVICCILA